MNMSSPALIAAAQLSLVQPSIWPCAFQSPTTKPLKPIRPFRTSVSRLLLPCIFAPFQLEKLAITLSVPAAIAGG
jgi:hypothetical protein